MLRGVLYERQSRTGDQSESLATQRAANLRTAEVHDVQVIAEIIEPPSTSAYKARGRKRPRFPELLELIRTGQANVVIAYKTDRLSRGGGPGWAPLLDAAEEAGLDLDRLVLTTSGFVSEFELGIRATTDREESKKASERSRDNQRRRAEQGRPAGGGHRAYGFDEKGMEVREAEVGVIREIVRRYIAGDGSRPIARWLNSEDVPTVTGMEWRDGTVRNVLANPRIAGLRAHNGAVVGDAAWPAIIDRGTWEVLQGRLMANSHTPGPSPWKYLLPRLLRCGRCGGRLVGAPAYGKARYLCRKNPGQINCGGLGIAAAPVDELVVGWALERLSSPVLARHMNDRPLEDDGGVTKIVELEARLEGIAQEVAQGKIPVREWSVARRDVEEQLQAVRSRVARRAERAVIDGFVASGENLRSLWDGMTLGRRQALLAALIDRIVVHPAQRRGSTVVDLERVEVRWRV